MLAEATRIVEELQWIACGTHENWEWEGFEGGVDEKGRLFRVMMMRCKVQLQMIATSNICKIPLATNVPESNAAGTLNLSKKKMKTNDAMINKTRSQ